MHSLGHITVLFSSLFLVNCCTPVAEHFCEAVLVGVAVCCHLPLSAILISVCSGVVEPGVWDPRAGESSPLTEPICVTNYEGQFHGDDISLTCLELSFPREQPLGGCCIVLSGFQM